MIYKFFFINLFFFVLPLFAAAQNCSISLTGQVYDASTGKPISEANIFVKETQQGTISDSTGFFKLQNFCMQEYHLIVSHIGCETQLHHVDITKDTILFIFFDHFSQVLDDVVVTGKASSNSTQNSQSLNEQKIMGNASQNLSNMLETLSGVNTLKNGSSISKPVVHGLYGNRITILNNGIAQSGQQWGNDHSPEIDPLVANKIRVVKGVGALEYQGSTLGSIVLVEPKKIGREPHLHGKGTYFFESNGLGNGLNLQLQKFTEKIAWKITGTLKKSGDRKTSNYFLRNTGSREANIALQLEKSFSERFHADVYFSSFNTILGVLRGSHVSDLRNLQEFLSREVPFYTEDNFIYSIDAPKQKVNHQLLKVNSKYFISNDQWLNFTYAGQLNIRKEFDIRRGGRTEIPTLKLNQLSHFFETKYQLTLWENMTLKTGIQLNITDNTNDYKTGILPLIPDYLSFKTGAFMLATRNYGKWLLEGGVRYDNIYQNVPTISTDTFPAIIVRYENNFHNVSASGGIRFNPVKQLSLSYNIGFTSRNPAINELYSNGLHQGVAAIEEGNPELQGEQSIKTTLSAKGNLKEKLFFDVLAYYQNINDYIYLKPQDEIRYTIRGAFLVFKYEQTDAQIYGLDLTANYHFSPQFDARVSYSFIEGDDLGNDLPLINIPADNLSGSLNYSISTWKNLQNIAFELRHKYVFQQNQILAEQDFVAVPDAYHLTGFKISAERQFKKSRFHFYTKVDNILNVTYRDYLNRQRYFADAMGRNVVLGFVLSF